MITMQIVIVFALVLLVILLVLGVVFLLKGENQTNSSDIRELLRSAKKEGNSESFLEEVKAQTGSTVSRPKKSETIATKLFKAGYYTSVDKAKFYRLQALLPLPLTIGLTACGYFIVGGFLMTFCFGILGLFAGLAYPSTMLDRAIRKRHEEILYYLPLVIEQISIGVSSGLDIGPCLSHIIRTADERGSHNPVTEMLSHVERLIQAGMNLEDSLMEVAESNGHPQLKHAFMFLGQCSKYGGEVSRQLQDLADSVSMQKQIRVEARIVALPVKATGPLAVVFMGFFIILISSLFLKVGEAFQ